MQSYDDYTAQMMVDMIVNYIQGQNHSVVYHQSGWVICLSTDCERQLDTTTTMSESDDNFITLIVGLVVGISLLCAFITLLLCIIMTVRRINIKSARLV